MFSEGSGNAVRRKSTVLFALEMMLWKRPLLLIALLLASAVASAGESCLVVGISDGDTLTARCGASSAYREVKVRLAEIDAPEKRQAFGQRSRASLAAMCFGRIAVLRTAAKDRYGRSVARVSCGDIDANAEQVSRGMAWVYTRYQTDRGLTRMEAEARERRMGLWADRAPEPPWEWRKRGRQRPK